MLSVEQKRIYYKYYYCPGVCISVRTCVREIICTFLVHIVLLTADHHTSFVCVLLCAFSPYEM